METSIGVALSILIGVLAILQGWSMFSQRRQRSNSVNNPVFVRPDGILQKLEQINDGIKSVNTMLGRVEQRVNDCWDKIKER